MKKVTYAGEHIRYKLYACRLGYAGMQFSRNRGIIIPSSIQSIDFSPWNLLALGVS
jgi:hypothetical protein